jgi:hypothetical protein
MKLKIIALILILAVSLPCHASKLALVIGNGAYASGPLKNPPNDARDMAAVLQDLGFEVTVEIDTDRRRMLKVISRFGEKLKSSEVGLFFYAGHGVQVNGINYLIPTHSLIETEQDVEIEGVDMRRILGRMENAGTEVNLIFIDACRDNPYKKKFRSASRGLAVMRAPMGTFIAFATAPGDVAVDGFGSNSPFTKHLIRNMTRPNLPVETVLKEVRKGVLAETGNIQMPWQSSSLTGEYYFRIEGKVTISSEPTERMAPVGDKETVFWKSIERSDEPAMFQAYLDQFPKGTFAALARLKLDGLEKPETLVPPAIERELPTLVYCSEGNPEGFNPALHTANTTYDASSKTIFDRLIRYKPENTDLLPGLAKSWDISGDGRKYTFHLRRGVGFHQTRLFTPTRTFNADDVIFSFMRQHDPSHPFHNVSGGTYEYYDGMSMSQLVDRIEKKDDYTIIFHLKYPDSSFLANLAMDFCSIHSAEFAEKMLAAGTPEMVDQHPSGTGPFILMDYQEDNSIRYRANKEYWGGGAQN